MSDLLIGWEEKLVPVSQLKPYERNPRRITEVAFNKLVDSLKRLGQFAPCIATADLRIIGGHQRIRAFTQLGWDQIRVSCPDRPLSDAEFKEILIKSNRTSGTFDIDILASDFEIPQLVDFGFEEKELIGARVYDDHKADQLVAPEGKVVTQTGDMWSLGAHRLVCGDATSKADVAKCLGIAKPALMITDPPYGVEYDAEWRNKAMRADGSPIGGRAVGKVTNDDQADWREAYALFPGNIVYAWCASLFSDIAIQAIESAGFERRAQIIWGKSNFAISQGHYHWQHEPCWYAVRKGQTANWTGDRKQTTLWQIDKPMKSETGHSTQKPVECMRRPIINHTTDGAFVYDPFLGSGTTLIAAEQTKRVCLGLEIAPAYCDVIIRRFMKFAPGVAVLHDSGKSFEELEASRP